MSQPGRIVVFLPNWVGDVVMATPAMRALREAFGSAEITYFGRSAPLALLAGDKWFDDAVSDESNRPLGLLRTVRRLRRLRADLAVLLPNSFRSAMLARMGGCDRRVGYARDCRGWLLSDPLRPPKDPSGRFQPTPMIDYYLNILQALDAPCGSRKMELPLAEADHAAAGALMGEAPGNPSGPWVMLNPGSAFGTSKNWPAERYAAVADELIERQGARIIINAAPNPAERALAAEVAGHMRNAPAVNFARRDNTLGLLKGLLRRCRLLITNDTGARHVAAAMGAGVVTIFGSTDPLWTKIDYPAERIVRIDVPCGPCRKKTCPLPPGPGRHKCLTGVTVEMVLDAAMELLADDGGQRL